MYMSREVEDMMEMEVIEGMAEKRSNYWRIIDTDVESAMNIG